MKYTIDYANTPEHEQRARAIKDCRNWLGDKFDMVVEELSKIDSTDGRLFLLSFAGIEGFPARVLAAWVDEQNHQDGAMPLSAEEERMDEDLQADEDWHERRSHYNPDKPELN